ncbi:patatin-like phospholipase family protein [Tundrisphaera sp. TA3]|uniref:patatin-like phospholipase family protein n=1 Tax=Tundrisphaera sp. TA3 TaxID=3435775 RepID=UPI003EBD10A1
MSLDQEQIPPGEDEAIRLVVRASEMLLDPTTTPVRRDQHPKQHGCVRAEFAVLEGLPDELRIGLFREPITRPAWVRFSNGAQMDDRKADVHGMAIKVMDVEGEKLLEEEKDATTHDFIMVDNPTFFLPDVSSYVAFSTAVLKARGKEKSSLRSALFFLPGRLRELGTIVLLYFVPARVGQFRKLMRFVGKRIGSPLATRYWSMTPYLFGPGRSMKFSARPGLAPIAPPKGASADYLRKAMADRLARDEAVFEFQVQLRRDEAAQPIEDPSVEWDEDSAPFVTVAHLRIPAQGFDTPEQDAFGEHLSFTPWHAIADHRPLGGINRARKSVYASLSKMRHRLNSAPRVEPTAQTRPGSGTIAGQGMLNTPETNSVLGSKVIDEELENILKRRKHEFNLPDADQRHQGADPAAQAGGGTDEDHRLAEVRLKALGDHLVGLSFSGGGIRSGTFAVGFLQGLAQVGFLRRIDYLSTVSGGGYAGSWLAAWLKRDGDPRNVERQLNPNRVEQAQADRALLPPLASGGASRRRVVDEEPYPLLHLRRYSSYLTPRPGLLTADTWTVIAIWLRNVSVNLMMMLLPLAMMAVLIARIIVFAYGYVSQRAIDGDAAAIRIGVGLFVAGAICAGIALFRNAMALGEFRQPRQVGVYRTGNTRTRSRFLVSLRAGILFPLIAAAILVTIPLRAIIWKLGTLLGGATDGERMTDSAIVAFVSDYISANLGLLDPPNLVIHASILGALMATLAFVASIWYGIGLSFGRNGNARDLWKYTSTAFIAGASAGVLFPLLEVLTRHLNDAGQPDLAATIVPPLALLIIVAGLFVEVALLGRSITEAEREWWSRLGAVLLLASLIWAVAMASIFYLPAAFLAVGPIARAAVASGWLATLAFGNLSGRRPPPRKGGGDVVATIAAIVPPIFLIGFLGAVSLLAASLVNMPDLALPGPNDDWTAAERYFQGVKGASFWTLIGWLIFALILFRLGTKHIDVNLFSLHGMYANRLVRCYIGASRPMANWAQRWSNLHDPAAGGGAPSLSGDGPLTAKKLNRLKDLHEEAARIDPETPAGRRALAANLREQSRLSLELVKESVQLDGRDANPETGFDPADDIPLYDLGIGRGANGRTYWGPQLLINTTLNLVAGEELAWRDRKGESFVLTPGYCGSKGVGYAKMDEDTRENLTLGRAITISGAAVDPNMSFYQSRSLTAFLTIFNARLGQWIQNPRFPHWKAGGPKFGDRLVSELMGSTDDKDAFIHLSDGGHFENMGVYELIRRRCRYIIAVDAGEDADASNDNLAQLTRLCRIDFGVRIELDTAPLFADGPNALSRTHAVVGRVHYEDVDTGQVPGIIVYVKISLTGDEPSDVLKYARKDRRFPHQPTDLRQSFTDEQFESYRALGDHIARVVFNDSIREIRDERYWSGPEDLAEYLRGNQVLFSALRSRWASVPADHDARFMQSVAEWTRFQRDLRREPALARLSQDLYPELAPPPAWDVAKVRESKHQHAELLAVSQMLQLMENAWINLRLKGHGDLPMDHGWTNVFRRWSGSKSFRRLWPILRSDYSPDFIKFCEVQLHLGIAKAPCHAPITKDLDDDLKILFDEFRREWPTLPDSSQRQLGAMIGRANQLTLKSGNPAKEFHPAWALFQGPSGPTSAADSRERILCGVILAAVPTAEEMDARGKVARPPKPDDILELFAWIRRPYRSTGLCTRAFLPILDELKAGLKAKSPGKSIALTTRYPRWGEGDLGLAMWKSFFTLYDFKPLNKPEPDPDGIRWTILEHPFHT